MKSADLESNMGKIIEGHVKGISLASLLTILNYEKTCRVIIKDKDKDGKLYFKDGNLIDAEFGSLSGEEEAFQLLYFDFPEIYLEYSEDKRERKIKKSITNLLLESAERFDEKTKEKETPKKGGIT